MSRKASSAAFTLIELLIVITIIAVLASIALPAYTGIQERANQTKDLSNGKQIALALRQFAIDNNGSYPSKKPGTGTPNTDYASATDLGAGDSSNDAFFWLFPTYLRSEDIFVVPGSKWTPNPPDNKTDPDGTATPNFTLASGECGYAYVTQLTDTSPPSLPLLADAFKQGFTSASPDYVTDKSAKGGVWAAKKAVVILCDGSGQVMKVDPISKTVKRQGHTTSIFAQSGDPNDPWLGPSNIIVNPK